MASLLAAAVAVLAIQSVVASPKDSHANKLVKKQANCNNLGIEIAESIIAGLGPLAGTQYCYSLLNVPQTTTTTSRTITSTTRQTVSTTTTVTGTRTSNQFITVTTTTAIANAKRRKRQATAKGKVPGNNKNVPTGTAASAACSCLLGPSPTQTLTQTLTFTNTATLTSTRTITSTTTTTITNTPTATQTTTVHFQRDYVNNAAISGVGCVYLDTPSGTSTGIDNQDCLDQCAAMPMAMCQHVFIEQVPAISGGGVTCMFYSSPFTNADVSCSAVNRATIPSSSDYKRTQN